jgi:hypothetical protein
MALPTSGPLSISMIKAELGSSSNSLRTLSSLAGFSTPDAMSEFYGYSNAPTTSPVTINNYMFVGTMELLVNLDSQGAVESGGGYTVNVAVGSSIQARANSETFISMDFYINGAYTANFFGEFFVSSFATQVLAGNTYEYQTFN